MDIEDWPEPRVTDNAVLLAGYLMAAMTQDPMYRLAEAKPEEATSIIETRHTGNRFRVRVEQIGGTE